METRPEELIRQSLLREMTTKLGFPKELIVIEKELSQFPHLQTTALPKRRIDIACFSQKNQREFELYPLIIIECKATPLTPKALRQLISYNYFIKAHFISLTNGKQTQTGYYNSFTKQYDFIPYLPTYAELLEASSGV